MVWVIWSYSLMIRILKYITKYIKNVGNNKMSFINMFAIFRIINIII